jgi:hypothetical protein
VSVREGLWTPKAWPCAQAHPSSGRILRGKMGLWLDVPDSRCADSGLNLEPQCSYLLMAPKTREHAKVNCWRAVCL